MAPFSFTLIDSLLGTETHFGRHIPHTIDLPPLSMALGKGSLSDLFYMHKQRVRLLTDVRILYV